MHAVDQMSEKTKYYLWTAIRLGRPKHPTPHNIPNWSNIGLVVESFAFTNDMMMMMM
jgi:hypothetical protein